MNIEIIIPNYNGFSVIKKNLPKVINVCLEYKNISITIVDDGSEESEYILLKNFTSDKKIKLLRNEKNLGFASSINMGIMNSKADIIVLLNTDVFPENGFLTKTLEDFNYDENLFGVGFMDKSIEGGKIILRGRGIGKWKRGFVIHSKGDIDKNDTFWISGGSCAMRRDIFNKIKGFDDLYNPFYWEDIDLSYRAQKSGYRISFEKESVVFHEHEQGAIKKYFKNKEINKIAYRNQFIFIWKNITDSELILSHYFWLPYHMLKAILRLDGAFFRGFLLALIEFPDIIKKRKKQKNFYKIKDKDIFKA